jgi:hypothetical protein
MSRSRYTGVDVIIMSDNTESGKLVQTSSMPVSILLPASFNGMMKVWTF